MGARHEGRNLQRRLRAVRAELAAIADDAAARPDHAAVGRLLLAACDCMDEAVTRLDGQVSDPG